LWFRNTWSWKNGAKRPSLSLAEDDSIVAEHDELGEYRFYCHGGSGSAPAPGAVRGSLAANTSGDKAVGEGGDRDTQGACPLQFLFCDNETNVRRHYGQNDAPGCFKDAFHDFVIAGNKAAVNPQQTGTKAAAFYKLTIPSGGSQHVRLRLARVGQASSLSRNSESSGNGKHGRQAESLSHLNDFDPIFAQRRREADEFYAELQRDITDPTRATSSAGR